MSGGDGDVVFGEPLTDAQIEALTSIEPTMVGGDAEAWNPGLTLLYVFTETYEYRPSDYPDGRFDLDFPPGQYIRHVQWNEVNGWVVTGDAEAYVQWNEVNGWVVTGDAEAYVQRIEDAWQEWDAAPSEPCDECGAKAHEKCTPGCQGEWR